MFKKIYIEITNICNLKCKFCPDTNRSKEYMSVENFEKIIKKIHTYTNLVCLHVKGEPLLHNDLEKILKILEKYKIKANITTNGTLIKNKLDILKKSKAVRQINISLHSITQNDILYREYLKDIFESIEELKDVIISYRLWNLQTIKENDINNEIIKEIENYYKVQNLKESLSQNEFIKIKNNMFINQDIEFTWPDINQENIIEQGKCLALKEQIAILVDGTVIPCCLDNNGDIKLGNILNESLEEILNKPKSIEIKKNFENKIVTYKLCKTCGFLKRLEAKRKQRKYKMEQSKIAKFNKVFPWQGGLSADLLFWVAIDTLFLTIVKNLNASQIVSLTTVSLVACIALQIPLLKVIQKIENTKSVRLGSFLLLVASILLTFGTNYITIAFGKIIYEIAFTFQNMANAVLKKNLELQGKNNRYQYKLTKLKKLIIIKKQNPYNPVLQVNIDAALGK